ncbi:MAG: hypothetical protein O2809_00615 [Proteobacteria bacterium]|nr:hypothetical protein [Pseudomonadota bacterium]
MLSGTSKNIIENKEQLQPLIAYNKRLQQAKHKELMSTKYHNNGLDAIYVAIEKAKQNQAKEVK